MFNLTSDYQYFVYSKACDMRKSFNGLCGLVTNELKRNPCDKAVYLFINKNKNRLKLLHWEKGGFVIYYKKLEKGTFTFPSTSEIKWEDLVNIVQGLEIKQSVQKKRFSFPQSLI